MFALVTPGWQELVIIFAIILLVFGPRKLPEVAEAIGRSIRKFRTASRDARDELESNIDDLKGEERKP